MLARLFALLVLLLPVVATAQPLPRGIEAYLDDQARQGFSGTVLVARHGVVFQRAYGLADREWGVPNTLDTRFKIGSLSKQFTAAAVLLLVQRGKLSLDDPLCRYVPDCPVAWAPIRIRQLLDHSSGIPDFVKLPGMRDRFPLPMKLDDTVALLKAQPLEFTPGSEAHYGNSGFLISAWLIEKLSGHRYADFLATFLYGPLGMVDSGYAADAPILPRRAHGYTRQDGSYANAPFIDMSVPIGAGSQYSTVGDLYRWDRALYGPGLLSDASRAAMFARGLGDFGLGWEIADEGGRRVIEHNGDINGFGAFIARYPDQDAAIIILTNTEGTRVHAMKDAIAGLLFAAP